jgi:hypothetical protein
VSKSRRPRPSRRLARKVHQRLAKSQAALREREERDLRRLGRTREDFWLTPEEVQGLEAHAAAMAQQPAPQPTKPGRVRTSYKQDRGREAIKAIWPERPPNQSEMSDKVFCEKVREQKKLDDVSNKTLLRAALSLGRK